MKTEPTDKAPFLSPWMKVRLSLFAVCAVVAVVGIERVQGQMDGFVEGIHQADQESFDSYVHFAKALKREQRAVHAEPAILHKKAKPSKPVSLWAAYDGMK